MCYAHNMRIDFHSHFPSPDSLVCTAEPTAEPTMETTAEPTTAPTMETTADPTPAQTPAETQTALLHFQGLLPDRHTAAKQARLFSNLTTGKHIHLGEVGLDKRFSDRLPMQKQADILRSELEFAIQNNRIITLHCVRATGLMLEILDDLYRDGVTLRPFSIIWHGFTGSPETARQLARYNIIISLGPRFAGSISDIHRANPATVPETDYEGTDAQEHRQILENQYERFARELSLSESDLEHHCENVFNKLNNPTTS